MFSFSRIALRNVFRNRRRSLITGSILVFGCVALILARGFMETMFEGARESAILQGIGHLQVYSQSFLEKEETKPLEYGLENFQVLQQMFEAEPHVRAAEARLQFMGLISNGDKSVAFMGEGVQPERQQRMKMLLKVQTGSDLVSTEEENPVILGAGLAQSLGAQEGDLLTLLSTTADGALNGIDVTVAGTFSTGFKEADDRLLSVRLETAQRLLDSERVNKLVVGLDRTENTELVKERLTGLIEQNQLGLALRTWSELSVVYRQVTATFSVIFAVMGLIIFVLVVLSSSNTMMMAVFERIREIGTLMALGTSRARILRLFLLEGLVMGVLGGAASVVLAWVLGTLINRAQIYVPPPPGTTSGFPITVQHVPEVFVGVFLLAVVMMVLGSVIPAMKGARLKVVDALGHI
jgi:putative ABC transport system permease protein